MRATRVVRIGLVPALAVAAVLSGCGKDSPTAPKRDPLPAYFALSAPQNVLLDLSIAYERKDSVETKLIYDAGYTGTSEDLNDPPGTLPIQFTHDDEVEHVARLARDRNITNVSFNIGSPSSWTRLGSDEPSHPEWAVIQISGSQLAIEVTEGQNTLIVDGITEFFEFSFQPTPVPSSPADTLWKIVRWKESRAAGL